jgi:Het-E N-terminal domain
MDPITTAIVAAITAGAATGATDVAKKTIVDGYEALKALVKKKFGGNSEVADAIEKLQTKPDSAGRRETLAEEVKASKAAEEPDLLAAARLLLESIKGMPNGEQHIQQVAQGTGIAQASGGSSATVNMYGSPGKKNDA